jgi:catechol 2,3-dioxygenase-like lactoylglutathione lyase family enzyme
VAMTAAVQSIVAVTYVRDLDKSRAFYELLGFHQESSGKAAASAWSALRSAESSVVLTATQPPLDIPRLPLLFYFYYADLSAAVDAVRAAGVTADHLGYPPHARGGEVKLLDPDGNTVLLGQREPSAGQPPADDPGSVHFSLLKEAAALVESAGGTTADCQASTAAGAPCQQKADVRLADSGGDSAWACLAHADEILFAVPGAYIATPGDEGITSYLARRQAAGAQP